LEDRACEEVEDCEIVSVAVVTWRRGVKTQGEVCVGKSGMADP